MQQLNSYVKIAEAAKILGISPNTLRAWADDDKIPSMINPANSYRLFRREDLEDFLEQASRPVTRKPK